MIFAREVSDSLTSLVKKLDEATAKNSKSRMGSFVIFLSDGKPTLETDRTMDTATALKNSGAKIYAVSVGESVQQDVMNSVASSPETWFTEAVVTRNDVNTAANSLLEKLCQ